MDRRGNIYLRYALALFSVAFLYGLYNGPGQLSSAFIKIPFIRSIEKYIGFLFLLAAFSPIKSLLKYTAIFFSMHLAFESCFKFIQLSPLTNLLSPMTSLMRITFPLIFVLDLKFYKIFLVACAFTFFGHGVEAIFGVGKFIDFFLYSGELLGLRDIINEKYALYVLKIIGAIDIFSAILLFTKYRNKALKFMVFWGFATALMRLFYFEFSTIGFSEFFLRIPHWIIPSLLLIYKNEN